MQTITKAVLAVSLFTCVVVSMQAASAKPSGAACQVVQRGVCIGALRRGMWPSLSSPLHMSTLGRTGLLRSPLHESRYEPY